MTPKLLISLYDHSGNASKPYKEAGWKVIQVDIKSGIDILTWDYTRVLMDYDFALPEVGIIAMQPCTCYALCGNRHKANRLATGEFAEAQKLVAKTKEIIDFFDKIGILIFWQLENPKTDIHKKNKWIGKIRQRFNPCDFAGYDPTPDNSRYNKETWLFGNFNIMTPNRIEPLQKDYPGWKLYGGKSEKIKELRSLTPLGFAYAFYQANN